ncbi:MAG TPA: trypsin-like peptidase domain-containing protein, partial [Chloroflexota bacterium]|nr:trypsin-like peptidase domain-containing protein [Chloroflexota bacterium]
MSRGIRVLTAGLLCGLLLGAPGPVGAAGRLGGAAPTISAVHFSNIGPNMRIEVDGAGFGKPSFTLPYVGEMPNFLFTDVTHNWSFGQPGRGALQYTSWTDTRIVINGFGSTFNSGDALTAGDNVSIQVQNAASTESITWTGTLRAEAPPAPDVGGPTPVVTSVRFSNIGPSMRIEVDGAGFGKPSFTLPYVGEMPDFLFTDVTHSWSAGQPGRGALQYTSWTDTRIVINGFGSTFNGGDILTAGDNLSILVQNAASNEFMIWTGILRSEASPAPDFGGPTPMVTGVHFSNIGPNMRIEVDGGGFGQPTFTMPYVGELPDFLFTDVTHNWSFGQPGRGPLQYTSWTDTQIVINGFGSTFNSGDVLAAGDKVAIEVQNSRSTEFTIWSGILSTISRPAPTSTPQPQVKTPLPRRTPAVPKASTCKVVTVATFDTCVEPSVLRVVKALPGGIVEQGSAFVIRSDASGTYLATNKHVVDGAGKDALTVYLPDGHTKYAVTAVLSTGGTDGTTQDLALIQLQPTGLRPLSWSDSTKVHSLQQVVAVGYGDAFDLLGPPSITQGSVSATGRDLGKCGGGGWIQHDAPLNHGNSGGPLLNRQGQVVGINTLKFDDQSACPSLSGFGFAIPSTQARATLGTLARLLPGMQGGLIGAISAESEIAARSIPTKPAALSHLR